ncbi:MAG: dGTP triphosphohydrolase [Pseudomonadota bacterium]
MTNDPRAERFHADGISDGSAGREADFRHPFEKDRDRILYSSAFHRLAGVTQIVRAGEEDVFHTRQQHTYKVAQVGRRLAQKLIKNHPHEVEVGGLHHEAVEAACLAHDLGHPPFGHIGEQVLDNLMGDDPDGFEGNAQTFRIVNKLSVRYSECLGLNLTRATLNACLKYPWLRDKENAKKTKKFSAYRTEEKEFEFARALSDKDEQSLEAHLMDWADDIAYSVHDLEDFHRCQVIPWATVLQDAKTRTNIVDEATTAWFRAPENAKERLDRAMDRLVDELFLLFPTVFHEPYLGTRDQRQQLRTLTSTLTSRYIGGTKLSSETPTRLDISENFFDEVLVLKQITRKYILSNPSLIAQQKGQQKIIEFLFEQLREDSKGKTRPPQYLPNRLTYLWDLSNQRKERFVCDCIASLTERECVALFGRLSGSASGSVLDPIVR